MSHDEDNERAYKVGYGKPPRWSRFRKGQSGNPNGRPPRKRIQRLVDASATDEAARAELDRVLQYTEGDKTLSAAVRSLLVKTLIKNGLGGDTHALKISLNLSQTLDKNDEERAQLAQQKKEEEFETFKRFRDHRAHVWARAERKGGEPDDPWPHPDDIILNARKHEWHVRGPFLSSEIPRFEYFRAERDAAFGRALLDIVGAKELNAALSRIKMLAWLSWDRLLPLRWQYAPCFDARANALTLRLGRLYAWLDKREAEAARMKPLFISPKQARAANREVERLMKPALNRAGFGSLAEVESAKGAP